MLLAIDIGNTNIVLGLFVGEKLIHKFRLETNSQKSEEDYAIDIVELFLNSKIDCLKIASVVIASVVPNLTNIIEKAVKKFYNGDALVVGKNLKLNIEIAIKNKQEVGFDRLINAIAGYKKFGGNLIIIDFGTATTFDVVGTNGEYLGGVIAPGVNLSIKALHDMTAQLPKIQVKAQKNVIGKSTVEAMNSGIYFGYISLAEGLIAKIKAEYGNEMQVIITGGLSTLFGAALTNKDHIQPDLTLEGLRLAALV
ncbi:MAG: type III pantothenate kinase [Pseudomonadota bacterium]